MFQQIRRILAPKNLPKEEYIRRGKIYVNVSIFLALVHHAFIIANEINQNNRTRIIIESIIIVVIVSIIIGYYKKFPFALDLVSSLAIVYIGPLPFIFIVPFAYIFDLLMMNGAGEWAHKAQVATVFIGATIFYILFIKFGIFKSLKEYRKSVQIKFKF